LCRLVRRSSSFRHRAMTISRVVSLEDYGSSGGDCASVTSLSSLSLSVSVCVPVCQQRDQIPLRVAPHELFSKAILQDPTMRPSRGEWRGNRVGSRCGPPFSTCSVKTRSTFIGVVRVYGRRRERKGGESANNEESRAKVCLLRAERREFNAAPAAVFKSASSKSDRVGEGFAIFVILFVFFILTALRYEVSIPPNRFVNLPSKRIRLIGSYARRRINMPFVSTSRRLDVDSGREGKVETFETFVGSFVESPDRDDTVDYYGSIDGTGDRCRRNLSSRARPRAPAIMQNHNNNGVAAVHSRGTSGPRRGPGKGPPRESHQLRLEINRRQMRRWPAGPRSRRVSDFSPPRSPLRTMRLFSANTKRYTRADSFLSRLRAARGTESTPRKSKRKRKKEKEKREGK